MKTAIVLFIFSALLVTAASVVALSFGGIIAFISITLGIAVVHTLLFVRLTKGRVHFPPGPGESWSDSFIVMCAIWFGPIGYRMARRDDAG